MTKATSGPAQLDERSFGGQAEHLLEAQYQSTDIPKVIEHPVLDHHPHYVPRTHEPHQDMHLSKQDAHRTVPDNQSRPALPRVVSGHTSPERESSSDTWALHDGTCKCVYRLYSSDTSAIVSLHVDNDLRTHPLLISCQASGRIVVWDATFMTLIGSAMIRCTEHKSGQAVHSADDDHEDAGDVVRVHLEHQIFGSTYKTVATAAFSMPAPVGCMHVQRVRMTAESDASSAYVALSWPQAGRACIVWVDMTRAILVPCLFVSLPDDLQGDSPIDWELHATGMSVWSTPLAPASATAPPSPTPTLVLAYTTSYHMVATTKYVWQDSLALQYFDMLSHGSHAPSAPPSLPPSMVVKEPVHPMSMTELGALDQKALQLVLLQDICVITTKSLVCSMDRHARAGVVDSCQLLSRPERLVILGSLLGVVCVDDVLTLRMSPASLQLKATESRPSLPHVATFLPETIQLICANTNGDDENTLDMDHETEYLAGHTHGNPGANVTTGTSSDTAPSTYPASATRSSPNRLPWTAVWPHSLSRILLALSSGGISITTWSNWLSQAVLQDRSPVPHSASSWDADVSVLQSVTNPRTGTRHLIGGSVLGDIGVWHADTLRIEASWSWFTSSVQAVVPLHGVQPVSRLFGCVLCVATDGTCALLALDDVRLVQLFPPADVPLSLVGVHENRLLLQYGHHRVRVWDVETQDLVRSEVGESIHTLFHGPTASPWACTRIPAIGHTHVSTGMLTSCGCAQAETAGILLANVRRAVDVVSKQARLALHVPSLAPRLESYTRALLLGASTGLPANSSARSMASDAMSDTCVLSRESAARVQGVLLPLTSTLVPVGLDPIFDLITPSPSFVPLGIPGAVQAHGCMSMACDTAPYVRFCISPEATAQHLLLNMALALLNRVLEARSQSTIDALGSPAFMQRVAGPAFVFPSLSFLALFILDENEVLRTSAKILFHAYAAAAPARVLSRLEQSWSMHLPTSARRPTPLTSHAVLLLGLLCAERYAYFSPALLKHVANMVLHFLTKPEHGTLQAYIALELCSGCHVWQHYIDTVDMVRRVFAIATLTEPEEESSATNSTMSASTSASTPHVRLMGLTLRGLARRVTLELAEKHSTLFMSTLAMDILHAPSVVQSQVTLRLVAFIIHQKPLVLYPSLPRLVEAVVKSLDPTHAMVRSSLAKSATLMINELVQTYPTIAFHGGTQRLAVGTHDGPVVLYDLKTGTRLYVLDGHKGAVTACSFSPDGRRFLSMSLAEELVLIWQLHAGVLDMFRRPSRFSARHEPSSDCRSIQIHLGPAAQLSQADTLRQVKFEWRDSRSVRLCVGQAHVNVGVV